MKPLMFIPPVVFAALAGLFFAGMMRENAGELPSALVGQQAPGIPTEAVPGTTVLTPEDLRSGQITLVNFWASWCPPCHAEHPKLLELEAQGYRIAGMNFRDQAGQAQSYLAEDGDPFFATTFDERGRFAIDWGVAAPPETFVVGPDGTILNRFTGPLIGDDFEQRFVPMLREAEALLTN